MYGGPCKLRVPSARSAEIMATLLSPKLGAATLPPDEDV